jgi:hypothetical protein
LSTSSCFYDLDAICSKKRSNFEKKYNLSSKEFKEKFDNDELGDSQDFFEWCGLLRGLKISEEKIESARKVLISC